MLVISKQTVPKSNFVWIFFLIFLGEGVGWLVGGGGGYTGCWVPVFWNNSRNWKCPIYIYLLRPTLTVSLLYFNLLDGIQILGPHGLYITVMLHIHCILLDDIQILRKIVLKRNKIVPEFSESISLPSSGECVEDVWKWQWDAWWKFGNNFCFLFKTQWVERQFFYYESWVQ